jgi:hypothetical protein
MKYLCCIGLLGLLAGCDASKAELESTKSTLSSVTKERDDLKTQVGSLQQQLDTARADLAKAKSATPAPAATTAAATPAPAKTSPAAPPKGKNKHKS